MTGHNTRRVQGPPWVGYAVTVTLEIALTAGLLLLRPIFPLGDTR